MADYMHQRLSSFPNSVEMERQIRKAFMMDGRSTVAWQIGIQAQNRTTSRFQQVPVFGYPVPVPTTPPRLSLALGLALSPPDRKAQKQRYVRTGP